MAFELVPVLDVMHGVVVRGKAGNRAEYRPLVSKLCSSVDPLDVAYAVRRHFGFTRLYLADLDAICLRLPNHRLYEQLIDAGFELFVDAGIRTSSDAIRLPGRYLTNVIGLETIASPQSLADSVCALGSEWVLFSLDLKNGKPLGATSEWGEDPFAIAELAQNAGVDKILVLDLGRVGMNSGVAGVDLADRIRLQNPNAKIYLGGGVRHPADLVELDQKGFAGVLVASALHDGKITVEDWNNFQCR